MATTEINKIFADALKKIGEIERCIEDAWLELKKEKWRLLWWHEDELIMPFYFHVRPCIDKLNEDLGRIQLHIIPQYAPKASSYARKLKLSNKFPRHLGEKEFPRTKHVDLGIVAFDLHDFKSRFGKSETTIWHIKHIPLVLLEFKSNDYNTIVKGMKNDLKKCATIQRMYSGVQRIYFCCLADSRHKPTKENYENLRVHMMKEIGIDNLKICYGTWHEGDWGIA